MKLLRRIRELRRTQDTLIKVQISKNALRDNYLAFTKTYPVPVAPVLKSNAYGHGLLEVAEILSQTSAPMLAVDSIHEVQMLRNNGIHLPMLVIGYTRAETIIRNKYRNVAFTITSLAGLNSLVAQNASANVHIK